jgi:hypothetical protein
MCLVSCTNSPSLNIFGNPFAVLSKKCWIPSHEHYVVKRRLSRDVCCVGKRDG